MSLQLQLSGDFKKKQEVKFADNVSFPVYNTCTCITINVFIEKYQNAKSIKIKTY